MAQLNSTNFFRWYTGTVADDVAFPRLGQMDAKVYLPAVAANEQSAFYINADIPFYDSDTNLQLRLTDGTVIATMQKVALALGYRLYCNFTFPNKPVGQYQYVVYNTDTNTIKCTSNYFQVVDAADPITVRVKYRNSRDAYYYDWSLVPDFYCYVRLHLSLNSYQPDETIDQTKAVSTGIRRNNNYDTDLSYKLNTYYFDDGANLACIPLFKCSELIINGKNYIQKTAYLPNARAISGVAIGEIELYDQYFSRINKFGQLPAPVSTTGNFALANNSNSDWEIKRFTASGSLLSTTPVPAGQTVTIFAKDLQYNNYLTAHAILGNSYLLQLNHTLPDQSWASDITAVTGTADALNVNQNAIYKRIWVVCVFNIDTTWEFNDNLPIILS